MRPSERRLILRVQNAGRRAGALGLLLVLCLIISGVLALADTPPPIPHGFYGKVTIGGTLAAEGTPVQAYVDGIKAAETGVDAWGEYELTVPGTPGALVTFRVDDIWTNKTATWESGAVEELNLTVGVTTDAYQLKMAVSSTDSGTAIDETGASQYREGATVNIKAVPAAGYRFLHWTATAGMFIDAAAAETIFTMPAQPVKVTANFEPEETTGDWCIATATGTGTACFTTSHGTIKDLAAVAEATLPAEGKPQLEFPHGFFSFKVHEIAQGGTVTVSITLPDSITPDTEYWKYYDGAWHKLPMSIDSDNDRVIIITLVDGGLGDADLMADGTIIDPGGPGVVRSDVPPEDKPAAMTPWIVLLAVVLIGITLLMLRRRRAQA